MFLDLDYNIKSIRWKDEGKQWRFKNKNCRYNRYSNYYFKI